VDALNKCIFPKGNKKLSLKTKGLNNTPASVHIEQ